MVNLILAEAFVQIVQKQVAKLVQQIPVLHASLDLILQMVNVQPKQINVQFQNIKTLMETV